MQSAIDQFAPWVEVGCDVRVKSSQVRLDRFPEQAIWLGRGKVERIEVDEALSAHTKDFTHVRVIIRWVINNNVIRASLLPTMIEPYPSPNEVETKAVC